MGYGYDFWKLTFGVIATIGLYSVLYKENKFYRFMEHAFLGLAAGWMMTALWTETLKENWWDLMVGRMSDGTTGAPKVEAYGYFAWAIVIPIGLMGYFVFSKKHAWLSRIPIGIILGLWSGQQFDAWLGKYGPQIQASMAPIWPTTTDRFGKLTPAANASPEEIARIAGINGANVYPSQAIINLIALLTVLCVLSYFLFSVNFKSKLMGGATKMGRYLLMIGFGAIFGSTVMMRFSLLIDRMYFIFIEWLKHGILHMA
jgi:hypothetical protein